RTCRRPARTRCRSGLRSAPGARPACRLAPASEGDLQVEHLLVAACLQGIGDGHVEPPVLERGVDAVDVDELAEPAVEALEDASLQERRRLGAARREDEPTEAGAAVAPVDARARRGEQDLSDE